MSILDSAELLLQAKNYSGSGDWLDEANSHNGTFSGPLFKAYDGTTQHIFIPTVSGNRLETPDAAALDILTDMELRIDVDLEDYTPATTGYLMSKWGSGTSRSWRWFVRTTGVISFSVTPDGTFGNLVDYDLTSDPSLVNGQRYQLRMVFDADAGGGNSTASFYSRTGGAIVDLAVSTGWTLIETVTVADTGGIFAGTDVLQVFSTGADEALIPQGLLYRSIIYNSAAAIAFDANLSNTSTVTEPYATFAEASSNAATVTIKRSSSGLVSTVIDRDMFLLTTDDYFEVADDAALDFGNTDDFTVVAVFRTHTVAAGTDVLVAKKDNLTTSLGYALTRATATAQGIIADGTLDDDDTVATVAIHTVHTAAFVRNTTGDDIEAFLDGTGSGSATTDSTTTTLANAFPLRIGATSNTAASFLEGNIIAVAVWASALTDIQVADAHTLLTTDAVVAYPHNRNVTAGQLLLTGG